MQTDKINGLIECLRRAGGAVLKIRSRGNLTTTEKKGIWDVVTEGDRVAERIITDYLAKHFSDDGIQAEEGTTRPSQSGRIWYPDSIDGTTNYSRGAPFFGISAGRADENGVPNLGVIHFPAEGWFIQASRGDGVLSDHPEIFGDFKSRPGADVLKDALVGAGLPVGFEHLFGIVQQRVRNIVMMGSCTYESLLVVQGCWDAYFHVGATQFDVAAATVIAREAGCVVTGIFDDDVNLKNKEIPFLVTRSEKLTTELRNLLIENWR